MMRYTRAQQPRNYRYRQPDKWLGAPDRNYQAIATAIFSTFGHWIEPEAIASWFTAMEKPPGNPEWTQAGWAAWLNAKLKRSAELRIKLRGIKEFVMSDVGPIVLDVERGFRSRIRLRDQRA